MSEQMINLNSESEMNINKTLNTMAFSENKNPTQNISLSESNTEIKKEISFPPNKIQQNESKEENKPEINKSFLETMFVDMIRNYLETKKQPIEEKKQNLQEESQKQKNDEIKIKTSQKNQDIISDEQSQITHTKSILTEQEQQQPILPKKLYEDYNTVLESFGVKDVDNKKIETININNDNKKINIISPKKKLMMRFL